MEEEGQPRGPLFADVFFTIVPSDDISAAQNADLIELVQQHGGQFVPWWQIDSGSHSLDDLSHIVSTSIDFPQYLEALESGVSVVKPGWVINSANKSKLANTRQYTPDPSQFFQDVVVTTSDLPEGDRDAIIAGVMALGGMYSSTLSKLVTHLVATHMDSSKAKVVQQRQLSIKIVLPHWFDDCLRLGRKINERPYLLPNPEVLQPQSGKIRDMGSPQINGATAAKPLDAPPNPTPESSPSEQRKNLNVLMSKSVMLSPDLEINNHLLQTLHRMIHHAGATIALNVDDADIYIGHFRQGPDYVKASRARKVVGNLSWLYHILNRNKWSDPLSMLMHYPVPFEPLKGFEKAVISLSSYNGEARTYLDNLIQLSGAESTKNMRQTNTHLITAHTQSEKCDAAQEWNLNVVNHIWLEESYANCEAQSLTNPRYTHFPVRTNLGEVVGQTRFNLQKLEQLYFPEPRKTPAKATQSPHAVKKTSEKPVKASSKLQSSAIPADEEPKPEPQTTKKGRGRPSKSTTTTPQIRNVMDDEKENESPSTRGSERAAKTKANNAIHDSAPDIALYNKEMKRKGGMTHGRARRSSHADNLSSPAPASTEDKGRRKKRPSDEGTYDVTKEGSELSDGETQARQKPAKKVKTELPPIEHKMMVTGDERWLDKANRESQDRSTLRQMGVMLTQDAKEVDILVAPKILRTRKFVCALASAPLVVDTKYLDYALKQKKLQDSPSTLNDQEAEDRLGFKLDEALERAKINDRKLLRGWHIFITKDVAPGFDTYKEIVTLNGGDAYLFQGRTGLVMPKRRLRDDPEAGEESQHQGDEKEYDFAYLVSGVSAAEKRLWKSFRDAAKKAGLEPRIVKNDWLLNAAMAQEVTWREEWNLDAEGES